MGSMINVGVDIGQKVDPTAICVAEIQGNTYIVRRIERLALGTPYPEVARRIFAVQSNLEARFAPRGKLFRQWSGGRCREMQHLDDGSLEPYDGGAEIAIFADATGVGLPVIEMMRDYGVSVRAVYLTGGQNVREDDQGTIFIPKYLLVSRLQVLFQQDRLKIPAGAEALKNELLNFEIKVSEEGKDTYGAFKTGTHDDQVVALGLATWSEPSCIEEGIWDDALEA